MKMSKKYLVILLFFQIAVSIHAQTIASFEINLSKATNGLDIPTSISLDEITFLPDSTLSLLAVQGTKKTAVPFQIVHGEKRMLHWLAKPGNAQQQKQVYQLVKNEPGKFNEIAIQNNKEALTIRNGNTNLLSYYYKTKLPPEGINPAYGRSGFIHPLWTPHGQELTRIQAPDHYHHYGIWNPWTHVLFEKDTVDFWNIAGKKGTVRFAKFISSTNGPVFSEFEALHEHVRFYKDGSEKVALNELQTVRVYKPEEKSDYYILDITSKMSCATESPFHILAYRYAGFSWRTTEFWNNENCEVLTSEGKTRKDTDGSKAKWITVQGALPGNDYGGATMLSYPGNYNHPEPLRIWVLNTNQRGDMFANFAPTKDKDWLLEPGKTYVLKYRMVVFNGKFDAAKAESAWQYYAAPPEVKVSK
jgi:hypothetical protein